MARSTQGVLSANFQERHWLLRYGLAVVVFGLVVGTIILNQRLQINLNLTIPIVLGLVAVVWYAGRGPGIFLSFLYQITTAVLSTIPPELGIAKALFGYISVLLFFLFLTYLISGLQRLAHTISAQRDLLQVTLSSIGDGVIATDTEGKITFMNAVAEDMSGWRIADARGSALGSVITIINEDTREPVVNPVTKVLETGTIVGLANHSILVSKDGRHTPIEDSAAPIRDGEAIRGVILVLTDATERKLAERARRETEIMHRIVQAQEGERHRIARGLHDQLGQQMTALRLKVESIADRCGEMQGLEQDFAEVRSAAVDIDRDIGFLSWELKPTELEELGLDNALRTFVREWSRQYGISAEFESSISPDLLGHLGLEVETNIYRIVQEALSNVLRHAEANEVSVLLQLRKGDLVLIIEDDGRGMAAEESLDHSSRRIGLAGMRERAALHQGTLEIDTSPGEGTAIIVHIPLPKTMEKSPTAAALV